jgi:hypothetical protein
VSGVSVGAGTDVVEVVVDIAYITFRILVKVSYA